MALPHLFRRVDALLLESWRHPDVGDQHLRAGCGRTADHLVVVGCHSDHAQVAVAFDEGTHALPHDQVVISEEYPDRSVLRVLVLHLPSCDRSGRLFTSEQAQRPVVVGPACGRGSWQHPEDASHHTGWRARPPRAWSMRYESSITSISWLPSEAVTGGFR